MRCHHSQRSRVAPLTRLTEWRRTRRTTSKGERSNADLSMVRRATHRRPRALRRRSPRGTAAPARIRPPLAGRRTSPAASASRDGLLASVVPTKAASVNSQQATRMRALRDVYHTIPRSARGRGAGRDIRRGGRRWRHGCAGATSTAGSSWA